MSAELAVVPDNVEKTSTLADRVMVLNFSFSMPGSLRKIKASDVMRTETDAEKRIDPESIKAQKEILRSKTLTKMLTSDSRIRAQVGRLSTPCEYVSDGYNMIPLPLVKEADALLEAYQGERENVRDRFVDYEYEDLKADAKQRLGPAYNEDDYLSPDRMRERFDMTWRWVAFDIPKTLKAVSRDVYQREIGKMLEGLKDAERQIKLALAQEFKSMVDHMVERLTPNPITGQAKVFRNTLTENLSEYLNTFAFRNVVDHAELAGLVERAKKILRGVDAESLRDSESMRAQVAAKFAAIKKALDPLAEEEPERAVGL